MAVDFLLLERYTPQKKDLWNRFVESSKNGTFLFNRAYMDYHSDRFEDFSFIFYKKDKVMALLPACRKDDTLYSHAGLTYGGLIMSNFITAKYVLEIFNLLTRYLKNMGVKRVIYKPVPYIYQTVPSDEDLYALFRFDGQLVARNISSTISLLHPLKYYRDRKAGINRAIKSGCFVRVSSDFETFWKILEENLKDKYNARPVHSRTEIRTLSSIFPDHIKLFAVYYGDEMVAGTVIYITSTTFHAQYISSTSIGKKIGAVDLLIDWLRFYIAERYPDKFWLDLGTSNLDGGRFLNESLIYQKEGFGARAVCYDTYEIIL